MLVPGLETSSFATTWCFGGHGRIFDDDGFVCRGAPLILIPSYSTDLWLPSEPDFSQPRAFGTLYRVLLPLLVPCQLSNTFRHTSVIL
jgi:hypothetical protein